MGLEAGFVVCNAKPYNGYSIQTTAFNGFVIRLQQPILVLFHIKKNLDSEPK